MLIVELFLEINSMNSIEDDIPQMPNPKQVKKWSLSKKKEWLLQYVQPIVQAIFIPYRAPISDNIELEVESGDQTYILQIPPEYIGKTFECVIDEVHLNVEIPGEQESIQKTDDDLFNYSISYLRAIVDFALLHRCIKDGNIDQLTVVCKRLIPLFAGLHSFRSK
jgi:hypothetical protein